MLLKNIRIILSALILVVLFEGCASIPRASVGLSEELTQMIIHSRKSHLNLLDGYTTIRKAEVDRFMTEDFIPSFTARFVAESGVLANIESAATNERKGAEILEFSEAAFPIINEKRTLLMGAVDQIDQQIRSEIEAHYLDMLNVNQALTAHLASAAEVVQTRLQLQHQLGFDISEVRSLDRANELMNKMLDLSIKAEDLPQVINDFNEKLKD